MSRETAFKQCSCGCSYSAEAWSALKCLGTVGDEYFVVELRNCTVCDSTCGLVILDRTAEEGS